MRLVALGALGAIALGGCGGMHKTYLPDGNRGYSISCRGVLNSWDSCLVKAGRVCGTRGYDTLRSSEFDRSLLISCKAPPRK
ncbi:MAG TPA: hypothetical protein VMT29_19545 [Steroidobacteraceae bacterium]|nr:hypothetical protein [Steroidobacteraceae bacterium]